uniref:F-box domain-containing protein n=1 Tax=Bionectria ochroleuca TaxID=29856 RepID=A0A8H7NBX0_BIOOC
MDWGHDYAGLLAYELAPTALCPGESAILRGRSLIGETQLPDPINIPELQSVLDQEGLELASDHSSQLVSSKISQDPFAIFPHEILVEILTNLDSADVVSLLIASRMFVSSGLSGPFWHSRFWPGKEFSHIFELGGQGSSAPRNWRRSYGLVKAINDNPALENRRRIWSLASRLNTLIRVRAQLKDCEGIPIGPSEGCENRKPHRWNRHMGSVSPLCNSFTRGSRALYYRKSLLEGWVKKITISVNRLNGKTYICGLSFVHQQGITRIGYHPVGRSGQQIDFHDTSPCRYSISGLEIARDPRGVRGIRILSHEDGWSEWVGDHANVPKKLITCERSCEGSVEPTITIIAGFDAMNMVLLRTDGAGAARLHDTRLWYPEIPSPCLYLRGAEHERLMEYRGTLPHSVCMFGGSDGAWLPHLTEVIVWGIDRSSLGETGNNTLVFGIEFKYNKGVDDGRDSIVLGHTSASYMATPYLSTRRVLINSAGGERITGIDVMYQDPDQMAGFIVYTSYGRRREFPPHCKHYIQVDAEDGCDSFSEELRPPSETCIVGLYSTLEHNEIGVTGSYDKILMDLGLICAKKV